MKNVVQYPALYEGEDRPGQHPVLAHCEDRQQQQGASVPVLGIRPPDRRDLARTADSLSQVHRKR